MLMFLETHRVARHHVIVQGILSLHRVLIRSIRGSRGDKWARSHAPGGQVLSNRGFSGPYVRISELEAGTRVFHLNVDDQNRNRMGVATVVAGERDGAIVANVRSGCFERVSRGSSRNGKAMSRGYHPSAADGGARSAAGLAAVFDGITLQTGDVIATGTRADVGSLVRPLVIVHD